MKKIEISKILKEIEVTDKDITEHKRKLLEIISSFKEHRTIINTSLSTLAFLRKENKIDIEKEQTFIEQLRDIVKKADNALKEKTNKFKVPSPDEILMAASNI